MIVKKPMKVISIFLTFMIIFVLALSISGCRGQEMTSQNAKMTIAVSIGPLEEFVEKICGDGIETVIMIPAGADPHTYEPRPSQLKSVSQAGMYVMVGSGLEFEVAWLDKLLALNEGMALVDCSKGIDLIETGIGNGKSSKDPHIWLSLDNAVIMTENIYEVLIEIDPDNSDRFHKNLNDYQGALKRLDDSISKLLDTEEEKKIIVLHPAWAYFARDYGIEQIPIEVEGKEPTPANLEAIIDKAKKEDIKIIFASPEFSTRSAEVIADEIGAEVVLISPVEKEYLKNMEKVAMAFSGIDQ